MIGSGDVGPAPSAPGPGAAAAARVGDATSPQAPRLGLLVLDAAATLLPGSVCNAATFGAPVEFRVVRGATVERCMRGDDDLVAPMVSAARDLVSRGCGFISSNCGFLAHYQEPVAAAVDAPVALSALNWLPTLLSITATTRSIGVLTFDRAGLPPALLRKLCGGSALERLVIGEVSRRPAWAGLSRAAAELDVAGMEEELLDLVKAMLSDGPDIGPILLECTAMAPFAPRLRAELARPVFDVNGMIFAFQKALSASPYIGVEPPPEEAGISVVGGRPRPGREEGRMGTGNACFI